MDESRYSEIKQRGMEWDEDVKSHSDIIYELNEQSKTYENLFKKTLTMLAGLMIAFSIIRFLQWAGI